MHSDVVSGGPFLHRVVSKAGRGEPVHVYIEGDGRPWIGGRWVARDPTPARPLMLELMALDPAPALYLGRPCYHGLRDPACEPIWWTHRRYAPEVVQSMVTALRQRLAPDARLVLIGHSGGGTLAMLMAPQLPGTETVVTLAGNLDVEAWARHHGYTPLQGSLNPAQQPPLDAGIRQLHLLGTDDRNVTAAMLRPTVRRQANAQLRLLENTDHDCCWRKHWPALERWYPGGFTAEKTGPS